MAFSATVRGTSYLGPALRCTWGDWSGVAGGAAGSVTVPGRVQACIFQKYDADDTSEILTRVTVSQSGFVSTITVENQDDVTTGRFIVFSLGQ